MWINIDVFFYKNPDGELQDMPCNDAKLIFLWRGNYGTPFLMIQCRILPEIDFTFWKLLICLY